MSIRRSSLKMTRPRYQDVEAKDVPEGAGWPKAGTRASGQPDRPRHLLVQNTAAGGHPLDVAGAKTASVPQTVAMLDAAVQDVRDGWLTTMVLA